MLGTRTGDQRGLYLRPGGQGRRLAVLRALFIHGLHFTVVQWVLHTAYAVEVYTALAAFVVGVVERAGCVMLEYNAHLLSRAWVKIRCAVSSAWFTVCYTACTVVGTPNVRLHILPQVLFKVGTGDTIGILPSKKKKGGDTSI